MLQTSKTLCLLGLSTLLLVTGCPADDSGDGESADTETSADADMGDGDGDGDGDSGDGDGDTGDGDGDTGDGDGDTGDGDGDGDTGDGDGDSGGELSHAADIQPIWMSSCGCHSPNGPASFLNLGAGAAYGNLVDVDSTQAPGVLRVATGDSTSSYLIDKLRGTHIEAGGSGNPMPAGANPPLEEAVIMTIEAWIDGGALP